jgi:hypothetical protein
MCDRDREKEIGRKEEGNEEREYKQEQGNETKTERNIKVVGKEGRKEGMRYDVRRFRKMD